MLLHKSYMNIKATPNAEIQLFVAVFIDMLFIWMRFPRFCVIFITALDFFDLQIFSFGSIW